MAKATRAAPKPAGRTTAPARTPPAASGGSKAQQAARHQDRDEEPRGPRRDPEPPKSQQVARRPEAATPQEFGSSASLPAFMKGDAGAGKENIDNTDLEIPRLKLIQGLSPELEDYNGLKPGNFFHTAAEEIFDTRDKPLRIVPIYLDKGYILWNPRDSGGGILARSTDAIHWSPDRGEFTVKLDKKDGGDTVTWKLAKTVAQSGLANWGTMNPKDPNSPPAATLMYNVVVAFPDHPEIMPAALTFQRSSIKIGRRFNTKLKTTRIPLFGMMFELSSVDDTNASGNDFKNFRLIGAGTVEDEALYNMYKNMHEGLKQTGLKIKDVEGLQDDAVGDNESEDDKDTDNRSRNY